MPLNSNSFQPEEEVVFSDFQFLDLITNLLPLISGSDEPGDGTGANSVPFTLEALLREQPNLALTAANAALERVSSPEREMMAGQYAWLVGLSQLYTNDTEAALISLQQARDVAVRTQQPNLAAAAYLGIQLVSAHQHQQFLRHHAARLQDEIEKQESVLSQQFHAMVSLALEAMPNLTDQPLPPSNTPEAQMQRVAAVVAPPSTQQLPTLEIRCFGEFRVVRGGEVVNFKQNRKPADILKYLLAHRERAASTDTLLGWLWPEVMPSKGIHRLHLNMSTLRQILNPPELDKKSGGYICTGANSYFLNPAVSFEVDVDQFNSRFKQGQALERAGKIEEAVAHYEFAVNLYRDDYLVENLYDEWAAQIRDHLRRNYVDMLASLCKYYITQGRYQEAVAYAKRMLDKDEYREDAHCFIMRGLIGLNQRNQALLQYQQCVEILEHDLGVPPMKATTDLYLRIKNGETA